MEDTGMIERRRHPRYDCYAPVRITSGACALDAVLTSVGRDGGKIVVEADEEEVLLYSGDCVHLDLGQLGIGSCGVPAMIVNRFGRGALLYFGIAFDRRDPLADPAVEKLLELFSREVPA